MRHVALAVATLSLVLLASQASKAVASELTRYDIVVTLVDEDIYLEQSKKLYLRTEKCVHRSDKEPAVLALDQENDAIWLVFHDGDVCRVVNASQDRGGI